MEYQTRGRELLLEMAANEEEDVRILHFVLTNSYPYLLERKSLTKAEINRYNSLVTANINNLRLRPFLLER